MFQLDREREERNFFQLERDKIHTFWEITRRQLEERKAELRNKVIQLESILDTLDAILTTYAPLLMSNGAKSAAAR